jgi:LAGLIDADG-like domain
MACLIRLYKEINLDRVVNLANKDLAYVLGFIATDGNIYKNVLSIAIQKQDCSLLKQILKVLRVNNPVKVIESRYCSIQISQSGIPKAFSKWGIAPQKSLNIQFPKNLPKKLIPHFIRGVFDGDGTVTFKYFQSRHSFAYRAQIVTASKDFAVGLSEVLTKAKISNAVRMENREKSGRSNLYSVCILASGYIPFYNYIYKDSGIHLGRKKQIFKRLVKHRKTYLKTRFGGFRKDKIRKILTKTFLSRQYKTKTASQIAKMVGVHKTTIGKYLRRYKILN